MATGILLRNCKDVTFTNVAMKGLDTGFEIYDSEDVRMTGVHCETRTAVSGERVKRLIASKMTHDDSLWMSQPTLLAILVRRAAHGHVQS